jgi:hypothetical protein
VSEFFRKNDGRSHNRTCQSTAASLIDSGNASYANGAEFFLIAKSTASAHFVNLTIQRLNDLTNSLNHSIIKLLNDFSFPNRSRFLALTGSKII